MSEKEIDQALVDQALTGDKEAFDILVVKYQRKITNLISRIVDDYYLVSDITQETFFKAYSSLDKFQGNSSFYTWLYRIAVNSARNHLKLKQRRLPTVDYDFQDAEDDPGKEVNQEQDSPERLLLRDEVQNVVVDAVNTLPEELRTSIVLREMAGLSYDEIAVVMKCPVGTVRSRIFRARSAVDEILKPYLSSS